MGNVWSPDLLATAERVCAEYGVALSDVLGVGRARRLAQPRFALYWTLRHQVWPPMSYPDIGRLMNRDHTTVMTGIREHVKRMGRTIAQDVDGPGELARCTADPFPRRCAGI